MGTLGARLPDRHRVLLGLYLVDGALRMLDAAALLQARLLAVHARLPVPALRVRGHRGEPRRRLAGDALRHPAHAVGRAVAADRRPSSCCRRSIRPGPPSCSVAWVVAAQGIAGACQGLHQDGLQVGHQGDGRGGRGPALFKWVAWFTGSKNAMKGIGFFVGGLLLDAVGFRAALWLMAGLAGRHPARRAVAVAARARQGEGFEVDARAVRQVGGRQSARGGAGVHVRRARRLVRRRPAGVPLRLGLAVRGGGRLPRCLDHRLWRAAGGRAGLGAAQRWMGSAAKCRARVSGPASCSPCRWRSRSLCPARIRPAVRIWIVIDGTCAVRPAVRRQLLAALLPDPGLCRFGEGGRGCRLLLRGERLWPPGRHAVVRACSTNGAA